jgi:hypothetical protein
MSPQSASAYNWTPESARYPPITLSDRRHLLLIDISFIKTVAALAREIILPAAPLLPAARLKSSNRVVDGAIPAGNQQTERFIYD